MIYKNLLNYKVINVNFSTQFHFDEIKYVKIGEKHKNQSIYVIYNTFLTQNSMFLKIDQKSQKKLEVCRSYWNDLEYFRTNF